MGWQTFFWEGWVINREGGKIEMDRVVGKRKRDRKAEREGGVEGGIHATSLEWRFIRPHQRQSVRSILITDNLLHNQHI